MQDSNVLYWAIENEECFCLSNIVIPTAETYSSTSSFGSMLLNLGMEIVL
jgi:hypothetical protein